jgi:lactoylglutathione lyase
VAEKEILFQKIDSLQLYVPDLEKGIDYYHTLLGLPVAWKTDTATGFLMGDGIGELVIQNERKDAETDISVRSVVESVERIKRAGGKVVHGPFEIRIGKCAVVEDPWGNRMVILDATKGTFITDSEGNITGQRK